MEPTSGQAHSGRRLQHWSPDMPSDVERDELAPTWALLATLEPWIPRFSDTNDFCEEKAKGPTHPRKQISWRIWPTI